jgi:hypothetical protein
MVKKSFDRKEVVGSKLHIPTFIKNNLKTLLN